MDSFRSCGNPVTKLQTLQFYGHFSELSKSFHSTAKVGSSMGIAWKLQTSQISHKSNANLIQITCESQANLVHISFKSQANFRQISDKCYENLKQICGISDRSPAYIMHIYILCTSKANLRQILGKSWANLR